ncbi:hypothetical protein C8F04DRAFT_1187953 [Mycena alexandri]|uniref:Uncharacterized protein n=1 Tax=Mycena alexandri TaxID=1745969 RepID=A0AAD6SMT5_9AGAR|nr:hypothetical protein C8F04DRAFT_1187953 [Mycena alexandri]
MNYQDSIRLQRPALAQRGVDSELEETCPKYSEGAMHYAREFRASGKRGDGENQIIGSEEEKRTSAALGFVLITKASTSYATTPGHTEIFEHHRAREEVKTCCPSTAPPNHASAPPSRADTPRPAMALRPRRAQIWSAPPTCVDLVRLCAAILRNSPTRRLRQHLAQAPSTNPSAPSSRAGGHRVEDWLTWRCCGQEEVTDVTYALGWLCASRSRSPPSVRVGGVAEQDVKSSPRACYPLQVELTLVVAAESNFDILSAKLVDLDSYDIGHALGLGLGLPHHALNSSPPANAKLVVHSRGYGFFAISGKLLALTHLQLLDLNGRDAEHT